MGTKSLILLLNLLIIGSGIRESLEETMKEETEMSNIVEIYEMDIATNVSNRFAKTEVTCKVRNTGNVSAETIFSVILPENAFISKFVMEVNEKKYEGFVTEKEKARDIYDKAVSQGLTAAHVAAKARDSSRFKVSLNIEPELKAVFRLTYEELLQRKNDRYELVININPGQVVKQLQVQVNINENNPLKFVKTPSLRSGIEISKNDAKHDPLTDIKIENSTSALVIFNPDSEKQKEFASQLGTNISEGISGQFVVQYDVERDSHGGEVLLQNGYFVHFFAPAELQPLTQHVIFVLDSSTSMTGIKIQQLKDAMKSILKEIRNEDKVSIVEFNSIVKVWDINSAEATVAEEVEDPLSKSKGQVFPPPNVFQADSLEKAIQVIDKIYSTGSTNIIDALKTALYLVKVDKEEGDNDKKYQPVILFLTDGDPTVGLLLTDEITDTVTSLNAINDVPIFSLSFGDGANKTFLKNLSMKNKGFSKHVYEASDASLQLQDFYKQISCPLLSYVSFEYDSSVEDVTKKAFPIYFKGSELVVAGKYKDSTFPAAVKSVGSKGLTVMTPSIDKPVGSLERLWAFMIVKQILQERYIAYDKTELTKRAVDLALKYSFVTEVTSLVVVKPNENSTVDTEDAYMGVGQDGSGKGSGFSGGRRGRVRSRAKIRYQTDYHDYLHASTTRTTTKTPIELGVLKDIPWILSVLNQDGTVTIHQKSYKLGNDYNATTIPDCPKTPFYNSGPGVCVLLKDCTDMYLYINTFKKYTNFFCPIDNDYAGVCCLK